MSSRKYRLSHLIHRNSFLTHKTFLTELGISDFGSESLPEIVRAKSSNSSISVAFSSRSVVSDFIGHTSGGHTDDVENKYEEKKVEMVFSDTAYVCCYCI